MKKTILLLSALLIFSACGTQELQKEKEDELTTSVLNVDEEVEDIEIEEVESTEPLKEPEKPKDKPVVKKKTAYQPPSLPEKLDALCSSKVNFFEEDDCYFEQIKTEMIYYKDNIKNTIEDVRICDRIRGVAWQYADCNQMFAVKNLNIDFCDYGSEPLYARPENSGYGTAEDCRKNLKYEYQDANWTATGASPTVTTWPYEYKGTAHLKGWMEYQLVYDPVKTYPFFHVAEESILKLPPPFQNQSQNYSISHNSPDILEALKTFGPENPATITVSHIKAYREGPPAMDITKVQ